MKVFVDSSVLIEFVKGNVEAKRILDKLFELDAEVFINDIVFSEFVFHYISLKSGVSPLTLKEKDERTDIWQLGVIFYGLVTSIGTIYRSIAIYSPTGQVFNLQHDILLFSSMMISSYI